MKFDKTQAEIEFFKFCSEFELFVNEDKYPQLSKMLDKGQDKHWKYYMKEVIDE